MNSKIFTGEYRIGILGGGQLGQMMIQSGISYNMHFKVLDPSADAPCKHICQSFQQGDFNDFQTVLDFGKDCDLVTIEIEHVNVPALKELENIGVAVYPSPDVIALVQDKGLQKQFYADNNIPTSPFQLIDSKEEIQNQLDLLPSFQKLRTGGYDGKGVSLLTKENYQTESFDAPSVLEQKVAILKELSFIVARNLSGQMIVYPPVELVFNPQYNLVDMLFAPAQVSEEIEKEGTKIAQFIASKLNHVGILAVEMFLDTEGNLLVNEMAPRPHNSGHHTIEGNFTSQFEQHLRAILNLPLGSAATKMPAAMINLLGEEGHTGKAKYEGISDLLGTEGIQIHLYGKSTTKPGRKMGHVTVVNSHIEDAIALAKKVKNNITVCT